jgi:DNA-binding LytR/AlgR family response regulator
MISAVVFDSLQNELNMVKSFISDAVSILTDEEIRMSAFDDTVELEEGLSTMDLCDICVAEFEGGGEAIDIIRKKFPAAPLLLVVDANVSPGKYIRPGVMPSALILRPSEKDEMEKTVKEFLSATLEVKAKPEEDVLKVETKSGILKVPVSQVMYFESRAKKVYLRLKNEEYSYYDTLDHLESELPDNFVRCHRGIIVNLDYVRRFVGVEKSLYLEGDICLPVSRSYNSTVRGRLK